MSGLPRSLGAQFRARFDGECPDCGESVDEGDLMGYVDNTAVCDGCYNDSDQENWAAVRAAGERMRESDRARDPEGFARQEAAVARWRDAVLARAAQAGTVLPTEEDPVGVEPGIQALMAAGLLQGQEPGGSGVCHAEIIDPSGKVTEVAIPVPVDPVSAKAGPEPEAPAEEARSTGSVEGTAADALARSVEAEVIARMAQLEANAKDWDPARIQAEVTVAARPDALQAGLQAAVESGAMTPEQAAALGWTAPAPAPAADIFLDALTAAKSPTEECAVLEALDNLAPYNGPADPVAVQGELLSVINGAITNHPRSLQRSIGPSEIGTECDHCLGAKLAGWEQVRDAGAWLPTVGTAVHSWLESAFRDLPGDAQGRPRYLTERKVAVGMIDGVEITGSTDLVDVVAGMTWDWKVVGATTLKSARVAPSRRYVVQQMLYARGWRRLGVLITRVGIAYLPRNDVSLKKSVFWSAPYDEALAVEALGRADAMARNLRALREAIGEDAVTGYVSGLPRWRSWRENVGGIEKLVYGNAQEGTIECLDCARYADYPADPAQALKQLEGIL